MASKTDSEDILSFWFSETSAKQWFNSTPEFDDLLREKFESVYIDAKQGLYDEWKDTGEGCLRLVILFDQLPLNIYRGKKESFATEALAREIASHALELSLDETLDGKQKSFLYMPFMHSEDINDQETSVLLYEKENLTGNIRFAKHHRDIVKRFGRFPHRNKILGRQDTKEEQDYLNSKQAFHG